MRVPSKIPSWAVLLLLLLISNLGWMSWKAIQSASLPPSVRQLKIQLLHTNDLSGVGLFEGNKNQPIWTRFSQAGKPFIENHFFNGEDVFDIVLKSNRPPVYYVYFHGPGKSVAWWLTAGGARAFNQRVFYDTNGDLLRSEVCFSDTWYPVERRKDLNGIVVHGQWHKLAFDTNGMWTIEGA